MTTTTISPPSVVIDRSAGDLAFDLGQTVARSLLRQAADLVKRRGGVEEELVVTVEDVKASVDESLVEVVRKRAGVADGRGSLST